MPSEVDIAYVAFRMPGVYGESWCMQCVAYAYRVGSLHPGDGTGDASGPECFALVADAYATLYGVDITCPDEVTLVGLPEPLARFGDGLPDTPHCGRCGRCIDHDTRHCP